MMRLLVFRPRCEGFLTNASRDACDCGADVPLLSCDRCGAAVEVKRGTLVWVDDARGSRFTVRCCVDCDPPDDDGSVDLSRLTNPGLLADLRRDVDWSPGELERLDAVAEAARALKRRGRRVRDPAGRRPVARAGGTDPPG